MHRPTRFVLGALVVVLASCSRDDGRTLQKPEGGLNETIAVATTTTTIEGQSDTDAVLTISAPWQSGAAVDKKYTCDGENVSPAISWTGGPADVSSWAVILTDLNSPTYAHWAVANIDSATMALPQGFTDDLVAVAMNSDAKPAYVGPCPPAGATHRYSLAVYALSQVLEVQNGDPAPAMRAAIEAAATEVATTEFTYSR